MESPESAREPARQERIELSDQALMMAVQQGDAEALGLLYDRYATKVYRIAKRIVKDEHAVEDIVQDVFTRVWTTRAYSPMLGHFDHWLAVVARRVVIDHVRKLKHASVPWPQDALTARMDETNAVSDAKLLRDDLLRAMSHLDTEQHTVMKLAYFGGFTLNEISMKLGMPIGTVKTRLHKGLKRMRAALGDWVEEVQR